MNSEKVKEIKKGLECCKQNEIENTCEYCSNCPASDWDYETECNVELFQKTLTLINELESENERLLNEKWDKEDDLDNYHIENQQLEDRIAELENGNEALSFAIKQGFNDCQTKTLKQFAERLKEKATWSFIMCGDHKAGAKTVTLHDIDETLKEFMDGYEN